jgi:hypothetical protein
LARTPALLLEVDLPTRSFVMQSARGRWRRIDGIGTNARDQFEKIERIVRWPAQPTPEWQRGFLAGIFDAEGSCSGGILRISSTSPAVINTISRSLSVFGFSFATDACSGAGRPIRVVRLLGGLGEHLRFFHTADPAILRKRNIAGRTVEHRSRLRIATIEPLGTRRSSTSRRGQATSSPTA